MIKDEILNNDSRPSIPTPTGGRAFPTSPQPSPSGIVEDPNFQIPDDGKIKVESEPSQSPVIDELSAYVSKRFEDAKREKNDTGVNDRLTKCQKQFMGEYDNGVLATIRATGGTDLYRKITMAKSDAAEAWIGDALISGEDMPFTIIPTPKPNMPPDITSMITERAMGELALKMNEIAMLQPQQMVQVAYDLGKKYRNEIKDAIDEEAKATAKNMQTKIEDQLAEGGWKNAISGFSHDFTIFPNAFVWGPFRCYKKTRKYEKDAVTGKSKVATSVEPILSYKHVSPFDIYPSPKSKGLQDGYLCHRIYISRRELENLKKDTDYKKEFIDYLLSSQDRKMNDQFRDDNDNDRKEVETKTKNQYESDGDIFEGVLFYGCVAGWKLKDWGLTVEDESATYEITATKIDNYVIKAVINDDEGYERPYSTTSFKIVPDSFWGISLPECMEDIQRQCNAVTRALCNNIALCSGPMMIIDKSQLIPNEKITKLQPWMLIFYNGTIAMNNRRAVEVININCNADQLLPVYNQFKSEADDVTNIPAFFYGNSNVAGAGQTASGLAMLQNNAIKGVRKMIATIGEYIIKPTIERTFYWNMENIDDESIKGDLQVMVKGPLAVTTKEMRQMRLNEFFNKVADPSIVQIIGTERFINILREMAKSLELPIEEIVPSRREVEEMMMMQAQQQMAMQQQLQQAQQGGGQQQPPAPQEQVPPSGVAPADQPVRSPHVQPSEQV